MVDEESGSTAFKFPPKSELIDCVTSQARPIAQRMRAVFYLRTLGGDDAVAALCAALSDRAGSTLFRHEAAYVLGQMQAAGAVATLAATLSDPTEDVIVRHEAGEALGAIADAGTLPLLQALAADPAPEVAETCQIAAKRVEWVLAARARAAEAGSGGADEEGASLRENPYHSVDPAPAKEKPTAAEVPAYAAQLLDASLPLFDRYKAMFRCG